MVDNKEPIIIKTNNGRGQFYRQKIEEISKFKLDNDFEKQEFISLIKNLIDEPENEVSFTAKNQILNILITAVSHCWIKVVR
jgi:hypothetical protein